MLRLALYSDQIIAANQPIDHALIELLGKPQARIGYIPSSSDPARHYFLPKQRYYQQYGLDLCVYAELDDAFDPQLVDAVFACDAIHLSGGNTFYFLYWLQRRGLLERMRHYAQHSGVLIGTSAGAILMTPCIDIALLCGDQLYPLLMDQAGLGLVDFAFVPHLDDTAKEEQAIQGYASTHKCLVYGCRDGEGIIVRDTHLQLFGNIRVFAPIE